MLSRLLRRTVVITGNYQRLALFATSGMSANNKWNRTDLTYNGHINVSLYKSTRSRLQVVVGDVPGPMVKGVVSFVTEANNDDGLPHTLEHLVFMGSKKYPFKGVLDIIANRCLASGTNAWTDQDHTAYTLSTVGCEGFLKVLPVYINHLLKPTLTKSQFATEVHHINGEGEDAGVVYSEMQDHESEMEEIMHIKAQDLLYPPANPYRVHTGGKLSALRDSCSVDKCRDFHNHFYHLSNMLIVVCGKLDHNRLLDKVYELESEELGATPLDFPKPFSVVLPPIKESVTERVSCPSDDPTRGAVDVHWFGPPAEDIDTHVALNVLFDYMENTAVAPLQKDFVNIAEPLAANASFHMNEQNVCVITLKFVGVPTNRLEEVKKKFMDKTLREHVDDVTFDMERMGFVIEQQILNDLAKVENKAHDDIFHVMIGQQIYGNDDTKQLEKRLDEVSIKRRLKSEPASFWSGLLKKYLTNPSVTVIGVPDEEQVKKNSKAEKARLDAQRKKLGEEGLLKKAEELQQAIQVNTAQKPPRELLDELIVRNLESFDRFPVTTEANVNGSSTPFLNHFKFPATVHSVNSKFVNLFLLLDSGSLSLEDRVWMYLFCELMFESPAKVDGKEYTAEEVAKMYTKDLIDHSFTTGVNGFYDRMLSLVLKVDVSKFANLAKWSEAFIKGIVYEPKRVKMVAQRLASEAREKKRDGYEVAASAASSLTYQKNSNNALYDEIVLEKIHEKIAAMCDKNPEQVVAQLTKVRDTILSRGVNAHFICDPALVGVANLGKWDTFETRGMNQFKCEPGEGAVTEGVTDRDVVIGVGGSESSFIIQNSYTGVDWLHADIVPVLLFAQYLSQTEGPLWRGIRGDGLAYGANIYAKGDRKMLTLSLYRCAQPSQAYEQTKKIVETILESGKVDESELEAAKRSLVFELMQREGSMNGAGKQAILDGFRGTNKEYVRDLCARIWHASAEDVLKIGGPYMGGLFTKFSRAITVHPSKVGEITKNFPGIRAVKVDSLYTPVKL